jgi:DNA-binding PadR family transcriptional regulator
LPRIDRQRVRALLPLAPQDLQLLLALSEGALHGYAMMKAVEEQSGGALRIELGSLYRMIQRLERDGLIEARAGSDSPAPGRDRRFYGVTRLGRAVIAGELERLREVMALAEARGARPREA